MYKQSHAFVYRATKGTTLSEALACSRTHPYVAYPVTFRLGQQPIASDPVAFRDRITWNAVDHVVYLTFPPEILAVTGIRVSDHRVRMIMHVRDETTGTLQEVRVTPDMNVKNHPAWTLIVYAQSAAIAATLELTAWCLVEAKGFTPLSRL